MNFFKNIVSKIEESKTPIIYLIISFLAIITLRNLIEFYTSQETYLSLNQHIHYSLFFVVFALSLIVIFKFFLKTDLIKIIRIILFGFIIIVTPPISDLIISLFTGKKYNIAYMLPGLDHNIISSKFFFFFGTFKNSGITPGVRIQLVLILLFSLLYFYLKTRKAIKSFIFTFFIYILIFFFASFPFSVNYVITFFNFDQAKNSMTNSYLLLFFVLIIILFFQLNKAFFLKILRSIRVYALLHFIAMFVLGLCLGSKYGNLKFDPSFTEINVALTIISIFFAYLFSVVIEKISKDHENMREYKIIAGIFFLLALIYASLLEYKTFIVILLFIGNYFLYLMPPFKLKRIFFLSKIIVSINSLALIMLGFLDMTGHIKEFPNIIIIFFLFAFTAIINFLDLKDYRKKPFLPSLKKYKFIMGCFFLLFYLSIYLFIFPDKFLIIPLIFFGLLSFYFVNKKKYREKYVFIIYLFSLLGLMAYLLF